MISVGPFVMKAAVFGKFGAGSAKDIRNVPITYAFDGGLSF